MFITLRVSHLNWPAYSDPIRACYAQGWARTIAKYPVLAFYRPEVQNVLRVVLSDEQFPGHYLDCGEKAAFYVLLNEQKKVVGSIGLRITGTSCEIAQNTLLLPASYIQRLLLIAELFAKAHGCRKLWTLDWTDNKEQIYALTTAGFASQAISYADIDGMRDRQCVYSVKRLANTHVQ